MATTALPEFIKMSWHPKYETVSSHSEGCPICGKVLKPTEKRRYIHIGNGGDRIIRADLPTVLGKYSETVQYADGTFDDGEMGWFAVGSTCAKKLGLEYSKELPSLYKAE